MNGRLPCWRDNRGMAGLELALLAPLFLFVMFSFVELFQYLRAVSIVERTAFSIGDMVAQRAALRDSNDPSDSSNIGVYWLAASVTAQPLDMPASGMVVISVVKDGNGAGKPVIAWQRQPGNWASTARSQIQASQPLPPGFPFTIRDNTVIVEVMYDFQPFRSLAMFMPPELLPTTRLYQRTYFRPRFNDLDSFEP